MKKTWMGIVLAAGMMAAVVAFGAAEDHHVRVPLDPAPGSPAVKGFVNVVARPQGGAMIMVMAEGLTPNTTYTSFYYESADCSAPADKVETFTSDSNGRGRVRGESDEDLDEIGSVSIRLGSDYGDLIACAALHAKE
jgi:hypothetical protein